MDASADSADINARQTNLANVETDITNKIELSYDPMQYDVSTREAIIPVRLRNTSNETLYGPFRVEVMSLGTPGAAQLAEFTATPSIVNAENHESGAGAVFNYSQALGSANSLPPNGLTEAILWKFRFEQPYLTNFSLQTNVRGIVRQPGVPRGR